MMGHQHQHQHHHGAGPGPGGDETDSPPRGRGAGQGRRGSGGGGGRPGPRGFGRRGGWQANDLPATDDTASWFAGRLPDGWFTDVDVVVDREEITVIGTLPDQANGPAAEGRISRFRAETKAQRIGIAQEAQARYDRTVSWGARLGDVVVLFTHLSVPVMTRLRQPERQVLDTLVNAGVARSRSDALAWSVRLVGEHSQAWLDDLRQAMSEVDNLRAQGPSAASSSPDRADEGSQD